MLLFTLAAIVVNGPANFPGISGQPRFCFDSVRIDSVRIDEIGDQLEQLQRILKEVE